MRDIFLSFLYTADLMLLVNTFKNVHYRLTYLTEWRIAEAMSRARLSLTDTCPSSRYVTKADRS